MATNFYYVYALKDPRFNPVRPFYIGKGTGSRAFDHLVKPDTTPKYQRIKEIFKEGLKPVVSILIDDLTEIQALKLEAELIAAHGTEATGGILTNSIVPRLPCVIEQKSVKVPEGTVEKAQLGLSLLKSSIMELIETNPDGILNSEAASYLGLRSDYQGKQKTTCLTVF